jgi:AsmA protein
MDGAGGFDVADGAIKGANLAKLARTIDEIRQGGINPAAIANAIATAQQPDEKTDFSELLSSFSIADGMVSAPTINLKGPFVTMTGVGDVNLPGQRLDLRLAPRATTTIDGEGGRSLAVPVRVTGSFSQPKLSIDAEALLRGRVEGGLRDFLNKAFEKDKGEPAAEGEASAEGEAQTPETAARDILKGVLGGGQQPEAEPQVPPEGGASTESEQAPEPGLEEVLINEALGGLFGRRKPATEPPAEDPNPEGDPER